LARHGHLHTPQAAADQPDSSPGLVCGDGEDLQGGAPVDQEVEVSFLDDESVEDKLPEVGEACGAREPGGAGDPAEAEVQAGDRGAAVERAWERVVDRPRAVEKDELLDALGGEELQPALDVGLVRRHVAAGEVDAAEGARVRVQDAGRREGDSPGQGVFASGHPVVGPDAGREDVGVDEGEGHGAPEAAPARGERGGARGVLCGEARHDVPEQCVGEEADAVDTVGWGPRGDGGGEGRGGRHGWVGDGVVRIREKHGRALHQRVGNVDAVALRVAPQVALRAAHSDAHAREKLLLLHGRRRAGAERSGGEFGAGTEWRRLWIR